jgi:hypothetical protein
MLAVLCYFPRLLCSIYLVRHAHLCPRDDADAVGVCFVRCVGHLGVVERELCVATARK